MMPRLLVRLAIREPRRDPAALSHPEFPIEQSVRGPDVRVQDDLVREARTLQPPGGGDAMVVIEPGGARVLGRSERDLKLVIDPLLRRFGRDVVVDRPRVRYVRGAAVLEPWMMVLMRGPVHFLPLIERDLARRRARIVRAEHHGGPFVLEVEAPLAGLLGYADWLDDLVEGGADLSMWLSRYVAVEAGDGPEAA